MKEIEVKAKIEDINGTRARLNKMGFNFSDPVTQEDIIFSPLGSSIPVENGTNVFRIRHQNGKYILTLKQQVSNQLDCIEHELEILDPTEMIAIIKLLNFQEVSRVKKTRSIAKHNQYEICLDYVEGLGDYIEIEKLSHIDNGEDVQKELEIFLTTIGIDLKNQVHDGYDILLKKLKS